MSGELIRALTEVVGAAHVPTARQSYERDWTGRFAGESLCVVCPADTDQVAAVLAACRDHG
ncbi:MAG: FAD-binding oxidoreductase, partial [Thermoleophilaceae bacterium]